MAPEREMIRRISPLALPVAIAAFALGTLVDGTDAGWSAAIAIVVVVGLAGRALLGALRVPDPGSTSFLATALMAVLAMLFLMGSLADTWMLVVLPVLGAVTFAVAQWVTSTHTSPGDRTR